MVSLSMYYSARYRLFSLLEILPGGSRVGSTYYRYTNGSYHVFLGHLIDVLQVATTCQAKINQNVQ